MTDLRASDGPGTGEILARRYRIEGLIGAGGMARVFRAEDAVLQRTVALKIFRDAGDDLVTDDRSRSETRLLASLSHPSLVTLFDAHLDDGGPRFLVMEYVDGNTLRERIASGPITASTVAAMATDIAEGLHVVHGAGVVHRDLKPSNVLITAAHLPRREFRAKLADFGIAYLVDSTRLTMPGTVIGTAAYLAPEQVRGEAPAPAADIYALGLVLIEALSGRRAFPQDVSHEAALARLVSQPTVPSTVSAAWRDLLTAMTAADPGERPTALDVAVAASALVSEPEADVEPQTTEALIAGDAPTRILPVPPPLPSAGDAAGSAVAGPIGADRSVSAASRTVLPAELPTMPEATPAGTPTRPVSSSTEGGAEPAASGSRRARTRRRATRAPWIVLGAIVLLAAAGFIGWGIWGAQGASDPSPSLPAVEAPLGPHLDDLLDAVTP